MPNFCKWEIFSTQSIQRDNVDYRVGEASASERGESDHAYESLTRRRGSQNCETGFYLFIKIICLYVGCNNNDDLHASHATTKLINN